MKTTVIKEDFPELYHKLLPDLFQQARPREVFAKCDNCSMVCRDGKPERKAFKSFKADRKCCTFFPTMPNYLVGALLADTDPAAEEGRERMRAIINSKIGVTPYAVFPPGKVQLVYAKSGQYGFGNSSWLICPFYHRENGNCTIWKFRNSVCSTYFCKHVAAEKGDSFWNALKGFMVLTERSLCELVLLDAGYGYQQVYDLFGNKDVSKLTVEDMDDLPPTPKRYAKIWGDWLGREEEFYLHAYRQVAEMDPDDLAATLGVKGKLLAKNLEERHHDMTTIPPILKPAEHMAHKLEEDLALVMLKKADLSFRLPSVLFRTFDGKRTWKEVTRILDEEEGMQLDERLLLSLHHYGILEEVEQED